MRLDAVRNRQKLLDVAERLFSIRGAEVEMDEIAAAAGVGVGTIYRHFDTKLALVQAIVLASFEDLIARAQASARASDPGVAFFEFFELLALHAAAKHNLIEAFARAGNVQIGTPAELAGRRKRFRTAFGRLLERAQVAGAVRRDVEVGELVALVNGAFTYLERDGGTEEAKQRLLALVRRAIAVPGRGRRRAGSSS
jgi:AcrR family transcriptional regulator